MIQETYGLLIRVFFSIMKNYFMVALIIFSSFPDAQKDSNRYAIWLENVNKNSPVKFVPTKQSRISSEHFSLDMFEEGRVRVILKPCVVPKIFPHSQVCMCLHILSIIDNASQVFYKPRAAAVQGLTTCKRVEQVTPNIFQSMISSKMLQCIQAQSSSEIRALVRNHEMSIPGGCSFYCSEIFTILFQNCV